MFFKNTTFLKLVIFFNLFLYYHQYLYAQNNDGLSNYYSEFDQYMGIENSELNIGSIYNNKYRTFDKSHPFYATYDYIEGTILYNNQFYQNQFKYDVFNDLIVVQYFESENTSNLCLISERIKNFTLGLDVFMRLDYHIDLKGIYRNGFFESVYSGELYQFYIKHIKTYQNKIIFNLERNQFVDENIYLIKFNERYYEINKKRDLLNLFPDKKGEIDSFFVRDNDITKESLYHFILKIDKPEAR